MCCERCNEQISCPDNKPGCLVYHSRCNDANCPCHQQEKPDEDKLDSIRYDIGTKILAPEAEWEKELIKYLISYKEDPNDIYHGKIIEDFVKKLLSQAKEEAVKEERERIKKTIIENRSFVDIDYILDFLNH